MLSPFPYSLIRRNHQSDGSRMPRPLSESTVLVTGASAGIGLSICRRLAPSKCGFVLAARSQDKLQQVATDLRQSGCEVLVIPTDVSQPNSIRDLARDSRQLSGRIDVLINNAGIECFADFDSLTEDAIQQTIATNLTGSILLTRHILPGMRAQKSGHIINMASTAGKHGPAFGAVYGATKAGLIAFTQSLRGELRGSGIEATAICPGFATDGGIYDDIVRMTGRRTPRHMGGTSAAAVAAAVENVIRKPRPEVILNFPWLRPVFVLREAFPAIGERLILAATRRFLRQASRPNRLN